MTTKMSIHRSSTVDNAMSFLTLFLKYESVSLVDVEKELGISKTAAFRLATTMTERGFLFKNAKTKRYYPGPVLFLLTQVQKNNNVTDASKQLIQELADLTKESVYLSIRTGFKFIFLTGVDSSQALKVTSPMGNEMECYCSAAGKLHLAYMLPSELDRYLKRTVLKKHTPTTITDPDHLREELVKIKQTGYSISVGESEPGAVGIAAPIWGPSNELVATLGIYLPVYRFNNENKEKLIKLARDYAAKISEENKKLVKKS